MDLFKLSAQISVGIEEAVDRLTRLGARAEDIADLISRGVGGNNEANVETDDAEENLEDLEEDLEDTEEEMEDVEDSSSSLSDAFGKLGKGVAVVGGAVVGLVGGFLALGESTREYREDMGKLETAFKSVGLSTDLATETYKDFYAVLGEEDRSVEAVNHLAKLTTNTQELSQWTTICEGIVGTFGDSLPIESLTESANETAKVGLENTWLTINWAKTENAEMPIPC